MLRGGIKKLFFFFKFPQKKLRFVWIFFGKRSGKGGGGSPIPKGFYHKILILSSNTETLVWMVGVKITTRFSKNTHDVYMAYLTIGTIFLLCMVT